mgnify:CR=1 FL=1
MTLAFILSWFAVMFPLVSSPGPANIVFAASGASFGIRKSIPLMLGVEFVFFVKSVVIGFGLGTLLESNPSVLNILQLLGASYLFYLAYSFLKPVLKNEMRKVKKLGFTDGIMIQFFNVKGWMLLILMFSLFSTALPSLGKETTVILLVLMLTVLNLCTHLVWISSSSYIAKAFGNKTNKKLQGILFSLSLFCVGLWFIWDSALFK